MAVAAGTKLGPYEVLGALGAGGMGEVYRARDERLGREVAIKILPAALAGDEQALRRMEQEARAVAALNHPNLLSVYDIGTTPGGLPYIVSELLEGEPLRQRLSAGALEQRKAVDYGTQIARGLAAAHEKGIIHRDLKPENIFITQDGRAKILDFGLAKLTTATAEDAVTIAAAATTPGMVLGTVGYMAPEQVRGQAADARSDIFSLGAVLYEMLTGKRAFRGGSAVEVMSAILKEEPEPLEATASGSRASGLTPALERIVRHCMEKEPRQRFQSADDVAFNLGDMSAVTSTSLAALPGAQAGWGRGTRWGLSAALVVALGVVGWLALRPAPQAPPRLLRATYKMGTIAAARFLPGGHSFVVSAAWNGASADGLYTSSTPTNADPATALQPVGTTQGAVVSVSPQGAIAVLAQDPSLGQPSVLSVIPPGSDAGRARINLVFGADFAPTGNGMAIARFVPATRQTTLEYPAGHVLYRNRGYISNLRFSRDGRTIGFLDHPVAGDTRGQVAVVDLSGHERTLTPLYGGAGVMGLAWSPDGREIWYSAAQGASALSLFAVNLSGRVRRLWQTPSGLNIEDSQPDGRVLLIAMAGSSRVRVANAADPVGTDYTIHDGSFYGFVSADGRQTLIDDESAGNAANYGTYLRTVGSASAVRLGDGRPQALSPDGHWALSLLPTVPQQFELLPTGPGEARVLAHTQIIYTGTAAFMPDGQGIVAAGSEGGRPVRSWLIGLNGKVRPITPEGRAGVWPTPDDKFLLTTGDQRQWWLYPIAGGAPQAITAIQAQDIPLRFGANKEVLYVNRPATDGPPSDAVYELNLATGARKLLFTARPADPAAVISFAITSISRDGKTYATAEFRSPDSLYVASGLHPD